MESNENLKTSYLEEEFPFPKLVKTFDFFFPQQKGAKNFFTMENVRKFARISPILGILILMVILVWASFDAFMVETTKSLLYSFSMYTKFLFFVYGGLSFLFWIILAIFAKTVKRSPTVCLAMSATGPLQALGLSTLGHFLVFIFSLLSPV